MPGNGSGFWSGGGHPKSSGGGMSVGAGCGSGLGKPSEAAETERALRGWPGEPSSEWPALGRGFDTDSAFTGGLGELAGEMAAELVLGVLGCGLGKGVGEGGLESLALLRRRIGSGLAVEDSDSRPGLSFALGGDGFEFESLRSGNGFFASPVDELAKGEASGDALALEGSGLLCAVSGCGDLWTGFGLESRDFG